VVVLDPDGEERWRVEGYLPKTEFRAQLEMGLARLDVVGKQWEDAERRYARVVDTWPDSKAAPEALYWRNVSRYSRSHDAGELQSVAKELEQRYPDSVWTVKATVWKKETA
jgi:TolA-binding protein